MNNTDIQNSRSAQPILQTLHKDMTGTLPKGFESGEKQTFQFKSQNNSTANTAPTVNFNGRRRGGPGASFAQPVEKAKNSSQTLKRLLVYLRTEKLLLAGLLFCVIFVTLTALAAPALIYYPEQKLERFNALIDPALCRISGQHALHLGTDLSVRPFKSTDRAQNEA